MSQHCKNIDISINDLPDNVVIYRYIDGDFVFVDLNENAKKLDNLDSDVIGKKITDVFDVNIDAGLLEKLFYVYSLGETQKFEIKEYKSGSIKFWRFYTIKKLHNGDLVVFYQNKNSELVNKLQQIKKQNKHFKNALVKLARIEFYNLSKTFKKILKITNKSLSVSRSSIWLYKKEKGVLECVGVYSKKNKYVTNDKTIQIEIPQKCIEKFELKLPILLDAKNKKNLVCASFYKYMKLSETSSFLLTPFLTNGKVIGIMVNASKKDSRKWNKSEIDFSVSVASTISLNIEVQKRKESELKFRQIAEISFTGFFIYNDKFIYANKAFELMTGYSLSELKKINPWELCLEEDKPEIKNAVSRRILGEKFFKEYSDVKIIKKDGEIRLMRIAVNTIMHKGEYVGAGSVVDITDIVKQKEKVTLLAKALEYIDKLVLITDLGGHIIYVNEALTKLSGYSREELIGSKPSMFKSKVKDESSYRKMYQTILAGEMYHDVIVDKSKSGEEFYIELNIAPIFAKENQIEYFVCTGSDVSNRIRIENRLKQLATIDSLTKIYNRYKINEIIEHQIARSKRYGEVFSLLMFDIDYFKKINDTHGHYVGDLVLKKLSELIVSNIREVDSFGRWGGEEFMLLLHKANQAEAMYIGEKIRKIVENFSIDNLYKITISVGVCTFVKNDTKKTLLERVDKALYASKENGRNRVTFK